MNRQKAKHILNNFDIRSYFALQSLANNLMYALFLAFVAVGYIWNAHLSEKMVRETDDMNRELKELRWEYMSNKSELMFKSKPSQVANSVAASGLHELRTPPKKIKIPPRE